MSQDVDYTDRVNKMPDLKEMLRSKLNAYHTPHEPLQDAHGILPSPEPLNQGNHLKDRKEKIKKPVKMQEEEHIESYAIRKRSSLVMSGDCRDRADSVSQL